MDMSSLFPADSGALSARAPPHVSFKAGMMNRDETTNLVTADERKGVFQIITSPEDQLMHLQWRALNTSSVDEDLIIFSGAAEMKRVVSCSATARVFVLKWKGVDKRMFFWMQGKDPTADEAHIAQVNTILENGVDNQQVDETMDQLPEPQTASNPPDTDVAMQPAVASAEDPTPATATPPTATRGAPITLDQIRAALPSSRTARTPAAAGTPGGTTSVADTENALRTALAQAQREQVLSTPTITELLNPDTLKAALEDPRVQEQLPNLLQHLPDQDRSVDRISELLRSPPLRTQAASLTSALQSGQAAELIRSFELPDAPAHEVYGLRAFLEALRALERQSKQSRE